MTSYGILLVDLSWDNEDLALVDKSTLLHHANDLGTGTQALLYVREPIDAVIAEAEITGEIIETEAPVVGTPVQGVAKLYLVPLKVRRFKDHTEPLSLHRLRMILGSDFSVFDETWIPLTEEQYQQITALWEKPKLS